MIVLTSHRPKAFRHNRFVFMCYSIFVVVIDRDHVFVLVNLRGCKKQPGSLMGSAQECVVYDLILHPQQREGTYSHNSLVC